MACEFTVGDYTYRAKNMDAFVQWSVAAKISPLIASGFAEILPMAVVLRKKGVKNVADLDLKEIAGMAGPIARELAKMPEEDRRFIASACLSLCERQRLGHQGWEPVWNHQAGISPHGDIQSDGVILLRIIAGVIQGTLANFSFGDLLE